MSDLLVGLALVIVIEGLLWSVAPDSMKRFAEQAATMPSSLLRRGGLAAMALGVLLVWLIRG